MSDRARSVRCPRRSTRVHASWGPDKPSWQGRTKSSDVVAEHYEAIERVAVALCYQGTLSGSQVAEIVERVEGAERSAA